MASKSIFAIPFLALPGLFLAAIMLGPFTGRALASTWTNTTSGGSWTTMSNWSGGVPNGAGAVADFSTLDLPADNTVHINAAETVGSLLFGDTTRSNNWILDNNGSVFNVLTLNVSFGTPTITVNNDTATISVVLAATQGMTKSGAGTLLLSGDNTYSGTTAINAGTVLLGDANALGSTAAGTTVASGATLDLGAQAVGGESLTLSGTGVHGSGALINSSAGAASLAGIVTAIGPFTVGGSGNITLSGSVNSATNLLTKIGNNTLILSGTTDNNNLAVTVNSGTVVLAKTSSGSPSDVHAIGQTTLTVNGGTAQLGGTGGDQIFDLGRVTVTSGAFDTNGRSETFATLNLQGTGFGNAGALVNSAADFSIIQTTNGTTLTANATIGVTQSAGSLTLNNTIGGSFGITKVGAGTLTLAATNLFTGGLTINAGNVRLGNAGALNYNPANSVTFGASSTGTLSLNGNSVFVGDLNGASSASTVQNASGTAATLTVRFNSPNSDLFAGVLQNGGVAPLTLAKGGTGTLALNGNNTYTGYTDVEGGTLVLGNASALGGTAAGVIVASGATLDLGGQAIGAKPLTIAGTGIGGFGALVNNSNSAASFAGDINHFTTGNSNSNSFNVGGVSDITLSGSVFSLDAFVQTVTKAGNNTLTLSGTVDNYTMQLIVNSGAVVLAKTSEIPVNAVGYGPLLVNGGIVQLGGTGGDQIEDGMQLKVSSGAAFDTNGRNETIQFLQLEGTGIAGGGALVNSAAGASILTTDAAFGTGLSGNVSIGVTQSTGSLTLNEPVVANGFGLTKVGAGTLVLSADNSFDGGLTLQQGALQIATINDAGAIGPLGHATSVALGTAGQNGAGQPIGTLEYTGATASSTMPFTMPASNGAIQIDNASTNLTLTGTIGVSGEFIKTGPGTLTLTANPTFNANSMLLINGGQLRFSNIGSATIGTGVTATVASGATLELAGSVSALSSGAHRANIMNGSNSPGLLVSGAHQQVGNIDGSGTTQVNAGSDLTANHIIQSALFIGGAAGSPGLVTIDASDPNGNPLASGLLLASSLTPSGPFGAGIGSSVSIGDLSSGDSISTAPQLSLGGSSDGSGLLTVPEPLTILISAIALLSLLGFGIGRRRKRIAFW